MAHFAEIDENNVVTRVVTVADEQEHRGNDFLSIDLGLGGRWIQTSYNNNIRGHFAGIGHTYNKDYDIFVYPQSFPSWTLDKINGQWNPPIPCPNKLNKIYTWDETKQLWNERDKPKLP